MGFMDQFCNWIKVIYTDPKAFIKINGFLSETVHIQRGIRQGCPLSCLVFIICTEFMSLYLKQSENIHGIKVNVDHDTTTELRITQYADDTCLFLKDIDQVPVAINVVKMFSNISGLCLNLTKTEGLCIGSIANVYPLNDAIKWPKTPIRYLGIYIGNDSLACEVQNWTLKIEQIQKLTDSWRTRRLTLQGKILILKTLAIPKLVYPASLLPIPGDLVKNVNKILYSFIWGKTEKVKRKVLINEYEYGGLKMIDLESHLMALKAAWIPRIYDGLDYEWTCLANKYLNQCTGGLLPHMSFSDKKHFQRVNAIPAFYQEVITSYCKANKPEDILSKSDLYKQCIWGNRKLTVNGHCLYSQSFIDTGYIHIGDVLQLNGKFRTDIYGKLNCKQHYMRTISLIQTVLKPFKHLRFSDEPVQTNEADIMMNIYDKKCKWFYLHILKQKAVKAQVIKKWSASLGSDIKWGVVYEMKIKNQLEIKIADFNYKLLNNILPTGCNLHRWKKRESTSCIYCNEELHDSRHLLFECPHVSTLWQNISNVLVVNITWLTLALGIHENRNYNIVLSLLCYIIYKKYLLDKQNETHVMQTTLFLKKEIQQRLNVYSSEICPLGVKVLLQNIRESL